MPLSSDLRCPSCQGAMAPAVMVCDACHVRVEGPFTAGNEFAGLSKDELHLLRIFVHCEGSIREMEAALGISYPTVKARLAALKQKLTEVRGGVPVMSGPAVAPVAPGGGVEERVAGVLAEMKDGRLSAAEAARVIREIRANK